MMVESLREKSRYSLRGAAVQSYCLAPLLYSIPRLTISDFEQQRRKRVRWQGSVSSLRNLLHNYVNLWMQIVMRGRDPQAAQPQMQIIMGDGITQHHPFTEP